MYYCLCGETETKAIQFDDPVCKSVTNNKVNLFSFSPTVCDTQNVFYFFLTMPKCRFNCEIFRDLPLGSHTTNEKLSWMNTQIYVITCSWLWCEHMYSSSHTHKRTKQTTITISKTNGTETKPLHQRTHTYEDSHCCFGCANVNANALLCPLLWLRSLLDFDWVMHTLPRQKVSKNDKSNRNRLNMGVEMKSEWNENYCLSGNYTHTHADTDTHRERYMCSGE